MVAGAVYCPENLALRGVAILAAFVICAFFFFGDVCCWGPGRASMFRSLRRTYVRRGLTPTPACARPFSIRLNFSRAHIAAQEPSFQPRCGPPLLNLNASSGRNALRGLCAEPLKTARRRLPVLTASAATPTAAVHGGLPPKASLFGHRRLHRG